ncbi:MAG TPA: alpha/beta fold hydrolase [Gemmatimonadota bacterium]|nr:alpha/beta fold hydrolase [Gemmatimonadota bacterium]
MTRPGGVTRALPTATLLLLFISSLAPGQHPPAGRWSGAIQGHDPPLALSVVLADSGGAWTGTLDLSSAGVLGVGLRNVTVDGPRVGFELPTDRGRIVFEGRLAGGSIRGRVRLGDREDAFALRPARADSPPYHTQPVEFANGEVALSGTLLVPHADGPHPAVVFLHGSGPERRDSAHHVADHLARCGIAALIWDKRGAGASTGGWVRASFADLAGDGAAAARRLREVRAIDGDRIGLIGHSQGAWLAPLVAARAGRIAFLALVTGGAVSPAHHAAHDDAARLAAEGYPDSVLARATFLHESLNEYLRTGEDGLLLAAALAHARREAWFDLTGLPSEPPPRTAIDASWWRRHMDYDPLPLLQRLALPMLAIFGGRDQVVPVEASAQRLRGVQAALERAGVGGSEVHVFPEADHTLHEWVDHDGHGVWPRLAEGYPELLVGWIIEREGGTWHGSCEPAAAPSGLTATAVDYQAIDLSWTDNASDEDGYRIERREGQTGSFVEIATVGPDITTYSDDGLTQQTEYCYRVIAFNTDGNSAYSNESCATTPSVPAVACTADTYDFRSALVETLSSPALHIAEWRAEVGLSNADPNMIVLIADDAICDKLWRSVRVRAPYDKYAVAFFQLDDLYIVTEYPVTSRVTGWGLTAVVNAQFEAVGPILMH